MSKIMRVAVLAMSLVSLFAVMSSAAGAVTWTNTGQTSFTATTGAGTLSSTGTSLTCASANMTGATTTPVSGVGAPIADATFVSGCRLFSVDVTEHCTLTLTANSIVGPMTSGNADVTCGVFLRGREACKIGGSTADSYTNGTAGALSVPASSTLIVGNGSGGGTCALGSNDRGSLTALTFNVTSGTGPVIATD